MNCFNYFICNHNFLFDIYRENIDFHYFPRSTLEKLDIIDQLCYKKKTRKHLIISVIKENLAKVKIYVCVFTETLPFEILFEKRKLIVLH